MIARSNLPADSQWHLNNADPWEVCGVIRRQFGACDFSPQGALSRDTAFLDYKTFGALDIVTVHYGCDVQITPRERERFFQFQLILDGHGHLRYRDEEITLQAGDASIIDLSTPIQIRYDTDCRKLIIRIAQELLVADAISFGYRVPAPGIGFSRAPKQIAATGALDHIIRALQDEHLPHWFSYLDEHYRRIFNHLIIQTFDNNLQRFHALKTSTHPDIEKIRLYLLRNTTEKVSADDLARFCCVSKKTIYNLFDRELGISPGAYITQIKLEQTYTDITNPKLGRNITEIAMNYGFTNLGRFSRQYRDYFGELPSATLRRFV